MDEWQQLQLLERALAHVLTASRDFDACEASQRNRPRDAQATEMATERSAASAREGIQTELARWELYDISGAVNHAPEHKMREQFRRIRASRGKPIEGAREDSLRKSWNAFISRWNVEPDFAAILRQRESARSRYGLGTLRQTLHNACWDEDRFCFFNLMEKCPHCSSDTRRPSAEDWRSDVAVALFGDEIRRLIGWYERALDQARRADDEPAPASAADPIEAPRKWTTPRQPESEQAQPRMQPRYP
jgi:hypothetical protein